MEVLQTTNYQQFRMVMSNREVDEKHVKRLVKSIREKNMLALNPIIVDEEMTVIDGQHRLEAAKELGLPVSYVVSSMIKKEDIARINSNQKNWSPMDYINYYTVEGNQSYIEISRLINQYPQFSVSALLSLASSTSSKRDYKSGHIDVSNIDQAREVCQFCQDILNKGYSCADLTWHFTTQRNFMKAIQACLNTEDFEKDELIRKIEAAPRSFVPCVDTKQYIDMIEEIYNRGLHSHNKIRLR